jgi:hypothetical protein
MLRGAGEHVVVDKACLVEALVGSYSFALHSPTTADGIVWELEGVSEQEIRSFVVVNEGLLEQDVGHALFLDPSTQITKKYPELFVSML